MRQDISFVNSGQRRTICRRADEQLSKRWLACSMMARASGCASGFWQSWLSCPWSEARS